MTEFVDFPRRNPTSEEVSKNMQKLAINDAKDSRNLDCAKEIKDLIEQKRVAAIMYEFRIYPEDLKHDIFRAATRKEQY